MARHRSRLRKPKGKPRGLGGHGTWQSPREQYVYSPEEISLLELAELWRGFKGCHYVTLTKTAKKQRWKDRRNEYQARTLKEAERKFMEKDSDRRTKLLEEASVRHVREGQALQGVGMETLQKVRAAISKTDDGGMKPAEALRAISLAVGKGFEIERKGLGIADRIELDYRTTEMTREVIQVLEMFIVDPDLMENIVYKLSQIGKKERDELQRITAGGDVDE